jgi:hypothetical protein
MSSEALAVDKWLLLGAEVNPENKPVHGVRLVFHDESTGLRGACVNWVTGEEVPLASLHFDGSTMELQMAEPDEAAKAAYGGTPTLAMKLIDDRFEGYWTNSTGEKLGGPLAPKLKMVRQQQ